MESTNTLRRLPTRMGFAVMLACSIGLTACGLANPPGMSPEIGQAPAVQQNIGAVRLSFKSTGYEALATKADVKNIRVTLSGGSLSAPMVKLVAYPLGGDISFDGVAPGAYSMKVEALDAAGTGIGQVTKAVDVLAGQMTTVNVNLKLIPTPGSPSSPGGVKVGIIIEDGDVVTTPLPTPSPSPTPTPTPAPTATPAPTPTPGSSAYGPRSSFVPTYDVKVAAGTTLNQTLLNQYADGTRIALEAGTYRITGPLAPKARQQILGFPGAVISGSKLLSGWKQDGTRWYVDGQTQRLAGNTGEIVGGNAMAGKSEDVFYDDKPLKQVDSLASVAPGKFFFDYTNSRIYLADNPTGHKVETTVTAQAFKGGGANVVLKNLVIEKFGNAGQVPAITNNAQAGWIMENCDVRYNHGWGVQLGDGGTVRGSQIRYQGQLGIGGGGNMLVENNEIAYNNAEGFNAGWEAGGSKWVYANGLTVRKNWVHHNYGPGLWTDIQNRNVIFEDNLVEANDKMGIMHEISWNAIIRNNTVRGNGVRYATWEPDGAGIVISTSSDVEVVGNTVEDNVAGVVMIHSPDRTGYDTKNNYVHGNTIKTRKGYSGIVIAGSGGDAAFTTNNNRFADNKYYTTSTSDKRWMWKGALRTFSEWKGFGQDTAGSVTTY